MTTPEPPPVAAEPTPDGAAATAAPAAPHKRRLHGLAVAHSTLAGLKEMLFLLVGALIAGDSAWQTAFFALFLPVGVVFGLGRWWRMRYWLEGTELRVSQGFLFRREVFLGRNRIQAIDTHEGLLHRLFGAVRVQIKTGAAGTQVDLSAVTPAEAERLIAALRPEDIKDDDGGRVTDAGFVKRASGATSRTWTLSPGRLLLLGALSRRLGILLSGIAYLCVQAIDLLSDELTEWVVAAGEAAPGLLESNGPTLWVLLGLGALTTSWFLSTASTVVGWSNFDVQRTKDRITVRRGLFDRRRVSLPADRLQAIRLVEGPFFLRLGYAAVYVESVGHQERGGTSTCLHPILKRSSLRPFLAEIAPDFVPALGSELVHPPGRAAIRFFLKPLLFWGTAAAGLAWAWPGATVAFAILVPVAYIAMRAKRETAIGSGGDLGVVVARGLSRTTAFFPRRRVQEASVTSGPLQRRRDLATASVVVASGAFGKTFTARDLDLTDATRLFDWLRPELGAVDTERASGEALSPPA